MHNQMAFTHGTIYIQNGTRFFVILLALTVDISLVRRLPVGSARALPPVSLLTWEMSTIGPPKFQTNLVYIWMEIVPAVTHIWSSIRVHLSFLFVVSDILQNWYSELGNVFWMISRFRCHRKEKSDEKYNIYI